MCPFGSVAEVPNNSAMRVLVTGGAGFVGLNLCRHLLSVGGYHLTVLDNLSAGQIERPPAGVNLVEGDYTEAETLAHCLRGIDTVVHLAASAGVRASIADPRPSFRTNVEGSFRLLEMARRANVGKFINASTAGAMSGDVEAPITERMPPSPRSPYGASKLAVEGYCSAFARSYGLRCVTLRFSNVYGPRSAHKDTAVSTFIKNILTAKPLVIYGDGTQRRDYLYVGDLVGGIEAALARPLSGIYHLGSGRPTTLLTLIATLKKVSGNDFEVHHVAPRTGEVHSTWCSIGKARRDFAYSAPTGLKAGLTDTWRWYVDNRDLWSQLPIRPAADINGPA